MFISTLGDLFSEFEEVEPLFMYDLSALLKVLFPKSS